MELLKKLYEKHSPSGKENSMRMLLKKECQQRGAVVKKDKYGNLLVTKGQADTYPCICAHMDQVQKQHSKDFTVIQTGDVIFGYSPSDKSQQGLGADDKNGLWIALQLLAELDSLKCAFFVEEESGCVGSNYVDLSFFSDVRFCLQADRKTGKDLITKINGDICSTEFIEAMDYKTYGDKPTSGLTTDVGTLSRRGVGVSCINISCGYYHPHTDHECTVWSELLNALDFARHICTTCTSVYPHGYVEQKVWQSARLSNNYYEWTYDYDFLDRETMREIVLLHPHMSFIDLMKLYLFAFYTNDMNSLRKLYKRVKNVNK